MLALAGAALMGALLMVAAPLRMAAPAIAAPAIAAEAAAAAVRGVYPVSDRVLPYGDTFVACAGRLYFSGGDPAGTPADEATGNELWRSDGTAAGTERVTDIWPGPDGASPWWPACVDGRVFFSATDPDHGRELWVSDGTAAGTRLVLDLNPGAGDGMPGVDAAGVAVGGIYFFRADDGTHGEELWRSDGTAAGTSMVKDIRPEGGSQPLELTRFGASVCFSADDGTHGRELWCSDGTAAGTTMVADIFADAGSSLPRPMEVLTDTLYFKARDPLHGMELWRTDGTVTGTLLVKDINPGKPGSAPTADGMHAAFQGRLYFMAYHPDSDYELWVSDGTEAGTQLLKDLDTSGVPDRSIPNAMTVVGDQLFFTANVGAYGRELWVSDGTEAGTVLVEDINPEPSVGSNPHHLAAFEGRLYFEANPAEADGELWVSDGTAAGTYQVADLAPGEELGSWPSFLTVVDDTLFFNASTPGVPDPTVADLEVRLWALGDLPADGAVTQTAVPGYGLLAGDTVTLALTLENRGYVTLTQVTLTETLPVSMSLQRVAAAGVTLTPTLDGPETYVWSVSNLSVGQLATVTLTAHVDAGWTVSEPFIITATLGAAEPETQPDDNVATVMLYANSRQLFFPVLMRN